MIDVHCHLNFEAFEKDYDAVAKRAFEKGVRTIINVGTKLDSSQRAVELAEQYDNMYAIVGVHPHHADKDLLRHPERREGSSQDNKKIATSPTAPPASTAVRLGSTESRRVGQGGRNDNGSDWVSQLEQLAKQPKVVAIGEIGLDNFRYQSNGIVDPKMQQEIFLQQLELAHRLKLPVQIHNRHAGKEIIAILKQHKGLLLQNNPGMFHCMSGNIEYLKNVLDLGFLVGFDGNITYKGLAPGEDTALPDLVAYAPLDRIVTETDSPYLTPIPHRGTRNEPAYVILVGETIARIKEVSFEQVVEQASKNARSLFKLDPVL